MTAQHLGFAARQVKLALAGIDPHVGVGHHQVGVAGEPEPRDVKQAGEALIRDLDVDVLEMDRVAEILGGSVELLRHRAALGTDDGRGILEQNSDQSNHRVITSAGID
nr:hypothetical protein [Bradyrhizobium neotropicale]